MRDFRKSELDILLEVMLYTKNKKPLVTTSTFRWRASPCVRLSDAPLTGREKEYLAGRLLQTVHLDFVASEEDDLLATKLFAPHLSPRGKTTRPVPGAAAPCPTCFSSIPGRPVWPLCRDAICWCFTSVSNVTP